MANIGELTAVQSREKKEDNVGSSEKPKDFENDGNQTPEEESQKQQMSISKDNSSEDVSFVDNCFSILDNEDSTSDDQEPEQFGDADKFLEELGQQNKSVVQQLENPLNNFDSSAEKFGTVYFGIQEAQEQISSSKAHENLASIGASMIDGRRDSLDLWSIQQLGMPQQAGYWSFNSLETVNNRDLWEYVCRNENLKSSRPLSARRNTSSLTLDLTKPPVDFETTESASTAFHAVQEESSEDWVTKLFGDRSSMDRDPRVVKIGSLEDVKKAFEGKLVKEGEEESYFVLDETCDEQTISEFEKMVSAKCEEQNDPSFGHPSFTSRLDAFYREQLNFSEETEPAEEGIDEKTFLVESEITSIIAGEKEDEEDMFTVFQRYLADPVLKPVLLRHLFQFCQVLNEDDKDRVAQKLGEFVVMDDESNSAFRSRVLLTDQLISMVHLFDTAKVNRYFSGFALAFSADRIADVRGMGILLLADVIGILVKAEWAEFISKVAASPESAEMPLTTKIMCELRKGFWNDKNWRTRQTFARLVTTMLKEGIVDHEQFSFLFCDDLIRIADDAVPNVRQYFCAVGQLARTCSFFKDVDEEISDALEKRLKQIVEEDSDMEIRYQAQIALGNVDPCSAALSTSKG